MATRDFLKRTASIILPLLIIVFAALLRILPHPPNVTPIAAMALFGGVYLDKKYALVFPLAAMFLADIFLGFHQTMLFVYGSFMLTGLIGIYLRKRKSLSRIFVASISASVLFFLITNFGVWLTGALYPKTPAGLLEAYYLGLPFFRNTLLGDLLYMLLLFGGYEAVLKLSGRKSPALRK